jgi:hypothetical protein
MHNLEFRGRWLDIFGNVLLITILTIITLGIYAPWGYARFRRVVTTLTYYQDRPLQFDGTGGQVFVEFLVIGLLTIITLGLYPILGFANTRLLRWQYAHTLVPTGQRLEYRGNAIDLFFEYFLVVFFSILTLGIYAFWGAVQIRRFILSHTYVDGKPLAFEGTGGQYFVIWLVNGLLTMITLGFYAALGFSTVRWLQWEARSSLVPMPDRASRPMPVHSPQLSALSSAAVERSRSAMPPPAYPVDPSQLAPYSESGQQYPQDLYGRPEDQYAETEGQYDPRYPESDPQDQYSQQYAQPYDERYPTQYDERYSESDELEADQTSYEGQYDERYRRSEYDEPSGQQSDVKYDPYDSRYETQYDEQYRAPNDRYFPQYEEEASEPDERYRTQYDERYSESDERYRSQYDEQYSGQSDRYQTQYEEPNSEEERYPSQDNETYRRRYEATDERYRRSNLPPGDAEEEEEDSGYRSR